MGTVLREGNRFNFQILEGIRDAYLHAFNESHVAVRGAILHPSLFVLSATRNVLVHKAGKVDQAFLNDREISEELRSVFPSVEIGKPLPIDGQAAFSLIQPVVMQSVTLIEAVSEVIGTG